MKVIRTVRAMQAEADGVRTSGRRIGFVPTMGALHEGHLSLIRLAGHRADIVVVSIFVNPTQFGPNEDLSAYPRDFKRDEALCADAGADIIFYPAVSEMYPVPFHTTVSVDTLTEKLCGASRPGHFQGVTTIVAKLFNTVKPHCAVFGQKDYQQAAVIRRMAADLNLDIEIITAPIIRESDGLAMSSRNAYLSRKERQDALILHSALDQAEGFIRGGMVNTEQIRETIAGMISTKASARIDYISLVHPETLEAIETIDSQLLIALAVFIGKTRLIDNRLIVL